MKKLLKFEIYRLWCSYALVYSILFCIPLAIISQLVVAANPQSPVIYGYAFEFFVPQMLVLTVPVLSIAREQQKGLIKTALLCGQSRIKVFLAKTIVYYLAIIFVVLFYILLLTFFNAKGLSVHSVGAESSFEYFLRCVSIGLSYCIALASLLLFIGIAFKSPLITMASGLIFYFIDFLMQSTVDWRVADKVVLSAMVNELMTKTTDMAVIASYVMTVVLTTLIAYVISMIVFLKKNYK